MRSLTCVHASRTEDSLMHRDSVRAMPGQRLCSADGGGAGGECGVVPAGGDGESDLLFAFWLVSVRFSEARSDAPGLKRRDFHAPFGTVDHETAAREAEGVSHVAAN